MVSVPIVETVVNLIITVMRDGGLPALLALLIVESFGIPPIPSEVILPFAGFLVAQGDYPFSAAVVVAVAGGVIGAYAAYAVGRWGRNLLTTGPRWLRLDPRHLETMDRWFTRHGQSMVLVARLLPVVRSYVSYPAGTTKMEPVRFGVLTAVGATPFAAVFIYLGVLLGNNWDSIVPLLQYADDAVIAILVVVVVYLLLRWKGVIRHPRAPAPDGPAEAAPEAPPPS